MIDTSNWPQWLQEVWQKSNFGCEVWRKSRHGIKATSTGVRRALLLLAQAEAALAAGMWVAIGKKEYCTRCHMLYPDHAQDCQLDAILARIRAGVE